MVFSFLVGCLAFTGPIQEGLNIEQLKAQAKKILSRAYSRTEAPPSYYFWEPETRVKQELLSTVIRYPGGYVSFSKATGKPESFHCSMQTEKKLDPPLSESQCRDLASVCVREFVPDKAFLVEFFGYAAGYSFRVLEQGVPFFKSYGININPESGIIERGNFPSLPAIGRTLPFDRRVPKESAIAVGLQTALEHAPELQTFEVGRVQVYWVVPQVEYRQNAPAHVLKAEADGTAIQAYYIGADGRRMDATNPHDKKVGGVWVDAETGRAFAGRLVFIDGAGGKASDMKQVKNPKSLYLKKKWSAVKSASATGEESSDPKGEKVLAMDGATVAAARFDAKKGILWLPSATKWKAFRINL